MLVVLLWQLWDGFLVCCSRVVRWGGVQVSSLLAQHGVTDLALAPFDGEGIADKVHALVCCGA